MSSDTGIDPTLVDDLLALETRERQTGFLREAGLLNAQGLDQVLDAADELLGDDPGKAHRLAELCADVADSADAPVAVPRSAYMRVRTYNENGEFDKAFRMIKVAHDEYAALGMYLEATRTNIGLMATYVELGRYQEALDAGTVVLDTLNDKYQFKLEPTQEQYNLLTALVHQNSGRCYEYMGRYDEALEAYAFAEERFRALGMNERIGEVVDNRGAVLSYLGRTTEALAAHENAARTFKDAGLIRSYAKALGNTGIAYLQMGNYSRSLSVFEQTRRLFESLGALAAQHVAYFVATSEAYLALNLYSEAAAACREALSLLRKAGMTHLQAEVLWSLGSALVARSEFEEAEQVLSEAALLFEEADNTPLLSGVLLEQASLSEICGDREAARKITTQALELVERNTWPVQKVYAHLRSADLRLPDTSRAELHLEQAQELAEQLTLPQLRYRLDERFGHLRLLQGRNEEARMLLESAVGEIERLRGTVTRDAMRTSFLRDKTAAFEDLLQLYLSWDDEEGNRQAFAVAEQAKSRSLVDLLSGVVGIASGTSVDPEEDSRLRNMQADLNAVYNGLLGGSGDAENEVPLSDLQSRAVELEEEISRSRLQAVASGVMADPFADTKPGDVHEKLSSDSTLIGYHILGKEIIAFINHGGRIRVSRQLGTVTAAWKLLEKLTVQWDRFRAGQEFAGRHMVVLERSVRQVLSALYEQLVAPLEPLLMETPDGAFGEVIVKRLAIVPHGLLHQVPFHALFDGEQYLIDRFEISYAPSATVYALCQERVSDHTEKALVLGVDDPTIPAATTEARAIVERLPGAQALVGEAATVEALRSEAPGCGTLHLACHGLFRSDNPMFSALKLHDGWLVASDAMSLNLDGALVTLSACESGRSEVYGGDETIGLTRAFLGAGAATLAVSLWLVQDETTAELMGGWYGRLRDGQGRAAALRAAQLEIKKRYAHPYYWAPFVLIGRR